MSAPLEQDYIGLTEISSSMEKSSDHKLSSSYSSSSTSSTLSAETDKTSALNLKQTELRLGLPGSESPERKPGSGVSLFGKDLEEKHNGYPISPLNKLVSGAKRGFLDTIDGSCGKWVFSGSNGSEVDSGKACVSKPVMKEVGGSVPQAPKPVQEKKNQVSGVNAHGTIAPVAKAQVVGWPPIRSFRKNTITSNLAKNNGELGSGCLYVKVSMDGAPYLRKVDLKTCNNYTELSSALEKMFSCLRIGQRGSHGLPGRDGLSESHLMDLLHGSEYVLSYEDKDGDWMLVGDVPWEMFTNSCRRLRIMKGFEAIGLAPRAMEKCKNRN